MAGVGTVGMNVDPGFWCGKRVFLSGHTGFKGSWLSLWLQSMGARVHGFGLEPATTPSLFAEARVHDCMDSTIGDIRNYSAVQSALEASCADIVIHMAAQALVRPSYEDPVGTYATNVMGTVHLLEAARQLDTLKAIVNVTTDKCYDNREWHWGYREDDALCGRDPYSNSKACSELVSTAYRKSFFEGRGIALATARAGNVIGGGDWSRDRLVPDILHALQAGRPVILRSPNATRPWQHVLDPLAGYLILAEKLYLEGNRWAEAWNFGPFDSDARTVRWIAERVMEDWGTTASWQQDTGQNPHEAHALKLDTSKAQAELQWRPRWHLAEGLGRVVDWHKQWSTGTSARNLCLDQIQQYMATPDN